MTPCNRVMLLLVLSILFVVTKVNTFTPTRRIGRIITTRPCQMMAACTDYYDAPTRRAVLSSIISGLAIGPTLDAQAALLWSNTDRRQLELCIVTILRVSYWAETVVARMQNNTQEQQQQAAYLEARLGAKAVLTGRVGGGANMRVYELSGLQLRGCLEDAVFYNRRVEQLSQDLLESLAAVVEFDGLETTQDPSPRSSLMLSMFTPQKATFVQRMLSERVVPTSMAIVDAFGPQVRSKSEAYIKQTYPSEVPTKNTNATKTIPQ